MQETVDLLEQRDREHLEENAELNEIIADQAAEMSTLKQQKHDALTQESKATCESCRLHDERAVRQQHIDDLRRRILRLDHLQMGSSDKLVALDYLEQAAARYWSFADLSLPFHPIMEQMAERLGLSDAQLTRINQTQKTAAAWKHDVKRTFKERIGKKEFFDCTVTVSLDKILSDPEGIEKPEGPKGSHQGGARVRRCKDCGSDDLDRYALEYCRNCKKAHAQLLPGLRADANIHEALDAVKQDRLTIQDHVFEYSQQDSDQEQKHHAFTQEEVQQLNTQLTSTMHQIDTQLTMQTTPTLTEIEQKHDAFVKQHDDQGEAPTTIAEPEQPQQHLVTSASTFYDQFCSQPGYSLRLRPDGKIGIRVPEHISDTEFERIAEQVCAQDKALRQVIQKHHAFVGQLGGQGEQQQHAEQLQTHSSNMQDKIPLEESQHHAIDLKEGARVLTPAGTARIASIRQCPFLHRPRCSVHTDAEQKDGSHFATFDLVQVQPLEQRTLL